MKTFATCLALRKHRRAQVQPTSGITVKYNKPFPGENHEINETV